MSQRLSIKHLQVLVAFRSTQNLSKIAEFLKLTPSAVSRRIEEAETRLGIALFAKAGNRVRLTPAGEHIVRAAERVLTELEHAEGVAARLGSDVRDVVRIGMSTYRNFAWFPKFVAHMRRSAPAIGIELAVDADSGGIDSLRGHRVDIIVTPFESANVTSVELFPDELVALVAPAHRLARRKFVVAADVEPEDFYTYSLSVRPGFEYLEFLLPGHVAPARYVMVETPESAAAAVRGGQGVTILSRWSVRSDLEDRRLVALPLGEHGVRIRWAALLRVAEDKRSVARDVADQLRDFFSQERERSPPRKSPAPKK
jgi:LysR family transcriptional regulator, regulator for metE and metH